MTHPNRSQRVSLALSASALVVAVGGTGGPALAAKIFADNSDKVDGKHAVGAKAGPAARAGKLVATNKQGRFPNDIIAKAMDADLLDGMDSSQFLTATGKAVDAELLDGLDSTQFLSATGKATDADLLDGLNSHEFLRSTGKAMDADLLDGKDASHFLPAVKFASGPGPNPSSTNQFLGPTVRVTVSAGQAVIINADRAFGTGSSSASNLNLCIGYRSVAEGSPLNFIGSCSYGMSLGPNQRTLMGLSAAATLPAGTYDVGLAGNSPSPNWTSNEYGYTTAMVVSTTGPVAAAGSGITSGR